MLPEFVNTVIILTEVVEKVSNHMLLRLIFIDVVKLKQFLVCISLEPITRYT
jgi:hypothetical protein